MKMTVNDALRLVKVIVVLHIFELGCYSQEVGSPCKVKDTGQPGVCRISSDCPAADEKAKEGIEITICGFHKLIIPIACCEDEITSFSTSKPVTTGDVSVSFPPNEVPNLQGNSFFGGAARKSEQKCLEYTKYMRDVVHTIHLLPNTEPTGHHVTKCDYNKMNLIVGGSPVILGEFPFMAAIGFPDKDDNPKFRCGGTIISEKWILTVGHCTISREGDPKWIRVGDLDVKRTDEVNHKDYNIDKIMTHPQYKYPEKYNDIALLSTTKEITFSEFVRPACLNTNTNIPHNTAIAAGWGQTAFVEPISKQSLLKVWLNIYDNSECSRAYEANKELSNGIVDTMLCAGDLEGKRDTCVGDSGGPLFIREKENLCKFYIIGITSFGSLCGEVNTPAVYTKVSEYIDWIENTIW